MVKQLVIQLARLGDIAQTKRLMLSLEREGSLALLVDYNLISFAQKMYPTAQIFGVHINNTDPNIVFEENLLTFRSIINENFTIVYPLNHSAFSRKICTLFSPKVLRAYSRVGVHARYSQWVSLAFRWMHNRKHTPLNLMDYWANFAPNPIAPELVNPVAKAGGKGIGIVLSGQNPRRSLCAKDYAKVIHAIYEREKNSIGTDKLFFFGTKAEENFAKDLFVCLPTKLQSKVHNLAGKTNLLELFEKLEGLDLLLSPDTGIAHVAAHLGVPVEAFYLSSAHCFETGPYGLGHTVWQVQMESMVQKKGDIEQKIALSCSPCLESQDCPYASFLDTQKEEISLLPCHKVFQSQAFLMHLDEKKYTKAILEKYTLENIVRYESSFESIYLGKDEENLECDKEMRTGKENKSEMQIQSFGLVWKGKQNKVHKKARQNLRVLLNAYTIASKKNLRETNIIQEDNLSPQDMHGQQASQHHVNTKQVETRKVDITQVSQNSRFLPVLFDQILYTEADWIFPSQLP